MSLDLQVSIGIITILSIIVLYYKGIVRKDWGIIGPIVPRIYLLAVIVYHVIIGDLTSTYFHVGIFLVLLSDLISSLFIIKGKRFLYETFNSELIATLQDLKLKYDFIVNSVPIGIYVTNITGRFEFINDAFCHITGYTREELLKMTVFDLISNEFYEQMEKNLIERISDKKPQADYFLDVITKSGKIIKVRVFARHSKNGHNTITGSIYQLGG